MDKVINERKTKTVARALAILLAVLTIFGTAPILPGAFSDTGIAGSIVYAETTTTTTTTTTAAPNFTDLNGHWAADIIKEAASRGIVKGYQQYDGTYQFKPDFLMNRQEFFTLVTNILSAQPSTVGVDVSKFCDVVSSEWYATTVAKAVAAGITDGTTTVEKDGYASFGINLMITRQEAAKIVSSIIDPNKTLTYDEMAAGEQKYEAITDRSKIATWASEHVRKVFVRGYMQGDDTKAFNPTNALTRAEAATLLLNVVKKETRILGPKQDASSVPTTTTPAVTTSTAVTTGTGIADTPSTTKIDIDKILKIKDVELKTTKVDGSDKGCTKEHATTDGAFTKGRGTRSDPYVVETEAQLNHIREHIGEEDYFILANDIKVKSDFALEKGKNKNSEIDKEADAWKDGNWRSIGTKQKPFDGCFDGNGYSIIGLDVKTTNQYSGLFGYISKDASVENLSLKACTISGGQYTGGIIGFSEGTVTNCVIEANSEINGTSYVGGVVGYSKTVIESCQNKGVVKGSQIATGGIVGYAMADGTITGCINDGEVSGTQKVGGIIGNVYGFGKETTVKQCLNRGEVSSKGYNAGGIVGSSEGGSASVKIENCANNGTLSGTGVNGGIVGEIDDDTTVTYCYNLGSVSGNGAGGIVGTNGGRVSFCVNSAKVNGKSYAGGILGVQVDEALLTQCYNDGYVYSDYRAGGLVGENQAKIRNCYNNGKVESDSYAGGLVGLNKSGVYYCYTVGKVVADMAGQLAGSNQSSFNYCFFSKTNGDAAVYEKSQTSKLEKAYGLTEAQLQGSEQISFSAKEKYYLIELFNKEYGKDAWETQKGWAYPGIIGLERL